MSTLNNQTEQVKQKLRNFVRRQVILPFLSYNNLSCRINKLSCSEAGQAKIQAAIKEKNLTGIVVCSCSPRMHETTFREAAERAGLNPYMVEIANIREHCSWIHKDVEEVYPYLRFSLFCGCQR